MKKKFKKSQLLFSQPFIYIFAIIVAALILVFGTKAILDLKEKEELVELTTFVTSLKEDVAAYYRFGIGSSKELNLNLPRKVKKVCFYENELKVFPEDAFILTKFKIPYLKPIEIPLCINTAGKLKAVIETKAKYVEIRIAIRATGRPAPTKSAPTPPSQCSDGTLHGRCSTTKPKYCDNANLIDKCSVCGCPSGQACQSDGSCKTPTLKLKTCAEQGGTCCLSGQICEGGSFVDSADCGTLCCVGGSCKAPPEQIFAEVPASCYNGNLTLAWQDEFGGSEIDGTKWYAMGGQRNDGYWVPDYAYVENGNLVIKTDVYNGSWGSGAVRTRGRYEPRYGYFEGRFKLPVNADGQVPEQIAGHWPAFWLFADTVHCDGVEESDVAYESSLTYGVYPTLAETCVAAWNSIVNEYGLDLPNADAPGKGVPGCIDGCEVDIFEYWDHNWISHDTHCDGYGSYSESTVLFPPLQVENHPNRDFFRNLNLADAQYHTIGLCWTPDEYIFYIDGVESHKLSSNKCTGSYLSDHSCASDDPPDEGWYQTYFHRYIDAVARTPHYIKITDEIWHGLWADHHINEIKDLPHYLYVDYVRVYQ